MYPEALPHVRAAILLRYRLLPLLHSLHLEAHLRGTPSRGRSAFTSPPMPPPPPPTISTRWVVALSRPSSTPAPPSGPRTSPPATASSAAPVRPASARVAGGYHPPRQPGSVPLYAAGGAVAFDLALPATVDESFRATAIDVPPAAPPPATAAPPVGREALMIFVPPATSATS